MNEQKFLNGLKAVKSELTWNAIFFGLMYLGYVIFSGESEDKIQFLFWIAFGFLIVITTLSAFINGYEKKI